MTNYLGKFGHLRFYDGTPGLPQYYEIPFAGADFTAPEGRPRPKQILIMDRNIFNSSSFYVQDSDEPVTLGLALHFTALLDEGTNRQKLRQALSNPQNNLPWLIGNTAVIETNGTSTIQNGLGENILLPVPSDELEFHVSIEMLWEGQSDDIGRRFEEVWFPPDQQLIREAFGGVTLECNGLIYGAIQEITTFTNGVEI